MYEFPAEVIFENANAALEAAGAAETAAERLYDLSGCERFDSALIAVLLELDRRARAQGALCRFRGAREKLLELADLYGVDSLLFQTAAAPS